MKKLVLGILMVGFIVAASFGVHELGKYYTPPAPTPTLFEINYPIMATWENLEGDYDRIQMTLYKDGTGFYDASFEDISEIQYVTWEVKERTVSKIRYRFEFTDHTGTYSGYFALYSNHDAYWDPGVDNLLGTWMEITSFKSFKITQSPEENNPYSEEIELLTQYFMIHIDAFCSETNVEYDEEGGMKQYTLVCPEPEEIKEIAIAYEEFLNLYNIDVIEVYRQSLILYSQDYGYLYWLGMEEEMQPKVQNKWQNTAQLEQSVQEYHGEQHYIQASEFISFKSIEDARGFIGCLEVPRSTPVETYPPTPSPFTIDYPVNVYIEGQEYGETMTAIISLYEDKTVVIKADEARNDGTWRIKEKTASKIVYHIIDRDFAEGYIVLYSNHDAVLGEDDESLKGYWE